MECSEWNRRAWGGDVKDHTSCCLIGIIIYTCDLGGGKLNCESLDNQKVQNHLLMSCHPYPLMIFRCNLDLEVVG
jgi:hypothetical protein